MKKKSKILSIILLVLLAVIIYIPLSCNSSCHSKTVESPVPITPVEEIAKEEVIEEPEKEPEVVLEKKAVQKPLTIEKEKEEPEPEIEPVSTSGPIEEILVLETEPEPEPELEIEPEPVVEIPEPEPEPEPVAEIPEPEPKPEPIREPEVQVDEAEYKRSTRNLSKNGEVVSKKEFNEDKHAILKSIEELTEIMDKKDFTAWIEYISPESRDFYSKPHKMKHGRETIVINGLMDYFLEIFIPAREKNQVKEIRYVSKTSTKAGTVEKIEGKKNFRICYNFVKINGKWYVELPKNIVIN